MSTQKSTREKLAQAIKEEMEQTSLDRITVARIVERAGVTRQTFYRNFKDKYDLVNWIFDSEFLQALRPEDYRSACAQLADL